MIHAYNVLIGFLHDLHFLFIETNTNAFSCTSDHLNFPLLVKDAYTKKLRDDASDFVYYNASFHYQVFSIAIMGAIASATSVTA